MAIYDVDIYAKSVYGYDTPILFSVQPFLANQYAHDELQITWATPQQVATSTAPGKSWTTLRLIRNFYGFPVSASDGAILLEIPNTSPVENYLDTSVPPGRFAYHSIFVLTTHDAWDSSHSYSIGDMVTYSGQNWNAIAASQGEAPGSGSSWSQTIADTEWVFAGSCVGLCVADWNYSQFLFDTPPRAYKVDVIEPTASPPDSNNFLWKFDQVAGFGFDIMKSENERLLRVNDIETTRDRYILAIAEQMGIGEELPDDPVLRRRRVLDGVDISRQKGSITGLETLIADTTGWGSTVTAGYNLLLDIDQASWAHPVLPVWNAGVRYQANEHVHYLGLVYRALIANQGNVPTGGSPNWTLTGPYADSTTLLNPTSGGMSTWTVNMPITPSSASMSVEVDGVPASGSVPARNCLRIATSDGGSQQIANVSSVSQPVVTSWSSASSYVPGNVVSLGLITNLYICILSLTATSTAPDSDPEHWAAYRPSASESLAVQQGVPLERVRPWDHRKTYAAGDSVSVNENVYQAIYPTTGVSPSGYRTDSRGWRWVRSESAAYTASVYYARKLANSPASQVNATISWYDAHNNDLLGGSPLRAVQYPPQFDRFTIDGPVGGTAPTSWPLIPAYSNPQPVTWIDAGGPWRVDNGICHTVYPPVRASGQLLLMDERSFGFTTSPAGVRLHVTFVRKPFDPTREQGLVFRADLSARTYWMMSRTRLTKNTYAADYSSVTVTQVGSSWAELPDNSRVLMTTSVGSNAYTGYAVNPDGSSTMLFTVTDAFSNTGLYHGLGERPM